MSKVCLHVLQYQPAGCMNRGESGEIKTFELGGVPRIYVSSQCWKKAMRDYARDHYPVTKGLRTKSLNKFADPLREAGYSETDILNIAKTVFEKMLGLGSVEKPKKEEDELKLPTVVAFTDTALNDLSQIVLEDFDMSFVKTQKSKEAGSFKKKCVEVIKNLSFDVQLFGRMVAGNTDFNVDGACTVAPAHSVGEAIITTDFFTAVDEDEDAQGSGMMGYKEMASGTLYRYGEIDTEILAETMPKEDIPSAVQYFVESFVNSIPQGMIKTYGTTTYPFYVYLTVRNDRGVSMSSAFVEPIPSDKQSEDYIQKVFENAVAKKYKTTLTEPEKVFTCGDTEIGENVHLSKLGESVCQYLRSNS